MSHSPWLVLSAAIISLAVGFKLKVLGNSAFSARAVYWTGAVLTLATIFWWGWWKF